MLKRVFLILLLSATVANATGVEVKVLSKLPAGQQMALIIEEVREDGFPVLPYRQYFEIGESVYIDWLTPEVKYKIKVLFSTKLSLSREVVLKETDLMKPMVFVDLNSASSYEEVEVLGEETGEPLLNEDGTIKTEIVLINRLDIVDAVTMLREIADPCYLEDLKEDEICETKTFYSLAEPIVVLKLLSSINATEEVLKNE